MFNKLISSIVDKMIHNKPVISRNSDISRIAIMVIIDHAEKLVVLKRTFWKCLMQLV